MFHSAKTVATGENVKKASSLLVPVICSYFTGNASCEYPDTPPNNTVGGMGVWCWECTGWASLCLPLLPAQGFLPPPKPQELQRKVISGSGQAQWAERAVITWCITSLSLCHTVAPPSTPHCCSEKLVFSLSKKVSYRSELV